MQNNSLNSLIVVGCLDINEKYVIKLDAKIDERELFTSAQLYHNVKNIPTNEPRYIVIENIENITFEEQQKFNRLLKDRRIGTYKLPKNISVIILVKEIHVIAPNLKKLCLIWKE